MPYTNYVKLRILHHHFQDLKPYSIAKALETEGIQVFRFGVHKFIIMYHETGSIGRRPGSGRISKVTGHVKTLVEEQMQRDDETTAHQLHQLLLEHGVNISFRTILHYELKEFCRREVKPSTKQELIDGIVQFWETVTVEKCNKYINHLKKVVPRVTELQGAAYFTIVLMCSCIPMEFTILLKHLILWCFCMRTKLHSVQVVLCYYQVCDTTTVSVCYFLFLHNFVCAFLQAWLILSWHFVQFSSKTRLG